MGKLKRLKKNFDKVTSNNSTDWQLALFWVIILEILASLFEYVFLESTQKSIITIPSGLVTELIIGMVFTAFIWLCVYNFIFNNKKNLLFLGIFAITGLYMVITKDINFMFLLHNLDPIHFFQGTFSIALIFELFIKFLVLYLLYRLVKIYRKK